MKAIIHYLKNINIVEFFAYVLLVFHTFVIVLESISIFNDVGFPILKILVVAVYSTCALLIIKFLINTHKSKGTNKLNGSYFDIDDSIVITKRKDMIDFLKSGVTYYSNGGKRGMSERGVCLYDNDNGGCCFIGRLLSADELLDVKDTASNSSSINTMIKNIGYVPERLKGFTIEFLSRCQSIHDDGGNWKEGKITDVGQNETNELIRNIISGYYD